jgi:hypothetical protein
MCYTMDDFRREEAKKNFKLLTPDEQREALQGLSPEELRARLSSEQIAGLLKKGQTKRRSAKTKRQSPKGKPHRKGKV